MSPEQAFLAEREHYRQNGRGHSWPARQRRGTHRPALGGRTRPGWRWI